jgi:hypothetical protein
MDKAEREALAVDIARRVRLLTVQTVPKELIDAIVYPVVQTYTVYGTGSNAYISMILEVKKDSIHITFQKNADIVARFRFDAGE